MDIPQSLQTLAEISIAFAGFSGLVIALRKRTGPLTDVHKYRLRVLLALAFGAMFLSLLPELLWYYDVSPDRLWAYCSWPALCFSAAFLAWWLWSSRRMKRLVPEIFDSFAVTRMAIGHVTVIIVLLGSNSSWLDELGPAPFVTALIWYLMHAAQQFARMLFIQPRVDDPPA